MRLFHFFKPNYSIKKYFQMFASYKNIKSVHKKNKDNLLKRKRDNNLNASPSKKSQETCEQNLD